MIDVPTPYADGGNGRGNYAVLNPIGVPFANGTVTDGNLKFAGLTTNDKGVAATISVSGGTFYWESTQLSNSGASNCYAGVILTGSSSDVNANRVYVRGDGYVYKYGTNLGVVFPTFTNNDVIGCAYDRANNTLAFYKNGTLGYTVTGLNSADHTPWVGGYTTTDSLAVNFGQRPFSYTPPTGFKALNTQNLPDATIKKGNQYFDVLTRTGDNVSPKTISGVGFAPDLIWSKARNIAYSNNLFDAVRGTNKRLISNSTNAEDGTNLSGYVSAFNSDGYTITAGSVDNENLNGSTRTYVDWLWKANGSAVTNTAGSITSTVSANTTSGFSIVTYTGTGANATVGHGLGVAPKMVIVKIRSTTGYWTVQHSALGAGYYGYLNFTNSFDTANANLRWNGTNPSSTVFSIGTSSDVNTSSATYVAYCFAEVAGYSKFGSYTGNGSANGPFVYCGFRPRYLLIKNSSIVASWEIIDTSRDPYNVAYHDLYAESSSAESTGTNRLDMLSNGFKIRDSNTFLNGNGNTVIYAAFAENPFKYSLAR